MAVAVGAPDGSAGARQHPDDPDVGPKSRRRPDPWLGPLRPISSGPQWRRARRGAGDAVRHRARVDVVGAHRGPLPAHRLPQDRLPPHRADRKGTAVRRGHRPGGGAQDLRLGPVERRRAAADRSRGAVRPAQTWPALTLLRPDSMATISWPHPLENTSMSAPDHSVPAAPIRVPAGPTAAAAVGEAGLPRRGAPDAIVVVRDADGKLRDLGWVPDADAEVVPVAADTDEGRSVIRHSAAHVLAQSVQELFPQAKLGIGPPITDGFYYDFDVPEPFTPEDLAKLEKRMRQIVKDGQLFERRGYESHS